MDLSKGLILPAAAIQLWQSHGVLSQCSLTSLPGVHTEHILLGSGMTLLTVAGPILQGSAQERASRPGIIQLRS